MATSSISRHLPLTTNRIEFCFSTDAGPLPDITPRIDFGTDRSAALHKSRSQNEVGAIICEGERSSSEKSSIARSSTDSDINGLSSSEREEDPGETTLKIRKPPGEPGRPGSGGYSIEGALKGWTPDLILDVKVSNHSASTYSSSQRNQNHVKNNAGHILDESKSYGKQKPARLAQFCISVSVNIVKNDALIQPISRRNNIFQY